MQFRLFFTCGTLISVLLLHACFLFICGIRPVPSEASEVLPFVLPRYFRSFHFRAFVLMLRFNAALPFAVIRSLLFVPSSPFFVQFSVVWFLFSVLLFLPLLHF